MAAFLGADTEALRTLSDRFREGSRRIEELRSTLEPKVLDESIWQGSDAEQFRSRWSSEVASRFGSVVEGVDKRHTDLGEQADEQDEASDSDGGGGGAGGGDGDGKSLWDKLKDVGGIGSKAYSLYKTGKGLATDIADSRLIRNLEKAGLDPTFMKDTMIARRMEKAAGGFEQAFKTAGGLAKGFPGLNHLGGWAGSKLDALPAKLGEGGKLVEKIGPDALEALGKGSKILGKAMPFVDIGVGYHQMTHAEDGYGKVSGGMAMAGGALMAAGVVCPPLAVVGGVLSGASLAMDLVDLGGGLFGADPSKAVSDFASDAAGAVGDAAKDVGGAIKDGLGSIF